MAPAYELKQFLAQRNVFVHTFLTMLTLIHGDDTAASRNYYLTERQKSTEKKIIDGTTTTLTDLMQILSGNGLFGDQETIFIEELFSKRKSTKDIEELTNFLSDQADAQIFVWESKTLTPKQIGSFKKAVVKEFKIPSVVFAFLDSIKPGNTKIMIKLYHDILAQEDAMYVLVMLMRQVRILLALNDPSEQTISEVSRMAPWQKNKMQKQAQWFGKEKLLQLHDRLFGLEYGQKTGNLPLPLTDAIDFLLTSL